ncbi:lasso peptide biosynthesis B2 protein [Streptomyces iconiensis]|uniref:Lasso peptide biosynthesis B2 protein n=1 Tax=Streptomyces iconiensis TaxID=1384038 RepID=A0ABT7A1N2_9ACTN|nr:lasso peptide biosynthesis B2 protein [Streptomyces iconiensis]MDJ1135245.1 lasso peptide biosynthesis B2 protein [Streptomyces iconiensis]
MSLPVTGETRIRLRWRRHLTARLAAACARLLIVLPPRRLRQVLRVVAVGAGAPSEQYVHEARQSVVTVSSRCNGKGCLQRSVATALLCRMGSVWPDWCVGVRTEPFGGHAWVEVDGVPVGEGAGMATFHTILSVRRGPGPSRPETGILGRGTGLVRRGTGLVRRRTASARHGTGRTGRSRTGRTGRSWGAGESARGAARSGPHGTGSRT